MPSRGNVTVSQLSVEVASSEVDEEDEGLPPAAPIKDNANATTVTPIAITVSIRPCFLPGWVFRYATAHNAAAITAKMMHREIGGYVPSATNPKIRNTTATTSAATAIVEVLPGLLSVSIAINVFFDARWFPGPAGVFCPS